MSYIIVIMKPLNIVKKDEWGKIMFAPKLKPCKANMEPTPFVLTKSHYSKFLKKKNLLIEIFNILMIKY